MGKHVFDNYNNYIETWYLTIEKSIMSVYILSWTWNVAWALKLD
jgi:hypothetical protein